MLGDTEKIVFGGWEKPFGCLLQEVMFLWSQWSHWSGISNGCSNHWKVSKVTFSRFTIKPDGILKLALPSYWHSIIYIHLITAKKCHWHFIRYMVTSTVGFSNVAMVPEASLLEWLNKLALPSHWHSIFYSQSPMVKMCQWHFYIAFTLGFSSYSMAYCAPRFSSVIVKNCRQSERQPNYSVSRAWCQRNDWHGLSYQPLTKTDFMQPRVQEHSNTAVRLDTDLDWIDIFRLFVSRREWQGIGIHHCYCTVRVVHLTRTASQWVPLREMRYQCVPGWEFHKTTNMTHIHARGIHSCADFHKTSNFLLKTARVCIPRACVML